jgi:hypothetical protein
VSRIIAGLALCLLTFISAACDKVPLTAPTGSTVTLNINSTTLPLNGTAEITAFVLESGGTAPQNGTVVTFATTLGTIEPFEARTTNGRAQARLIAGTRSGTASVRAFSGDAETEAVEVLIGGAGATRILLRVESVSSDGTRTVIVATVLDEPGNPVPGLPVSFTATKGTLSPGLATTDNNGEARTTLTTSETSTVTAQAGTATGPGTLTIAAPGSIALTSTPAPPATVEAGQPVTFTVTPASGFFFSDVVVNFGDGQTENLGVVSAARTFTHIYNARGNYTVTARANGPNGSTSASVTVTVTDRAPLQVSLAAAPNPVALLGIRGLTTLTATVTPTAGATAAPIARVEWDFGDNTPIATGTALTINHEYPPVAPQSYVATVRVVTTDGREGSASTTVLVVP